MAGVSRHMARSLVSSARAAGRLCGTKPAGSAGAERGAAAAAGGRGGGLGGGASRPATGSAGSSFSSPKSFCMDSRQPGAFSFFRRLPGKWRVCNRCCPCTMQQRQRAWCRSLASQQAPSSRDSGLLTMPDKTPSSSSWWDVSHVWSRHRILSNQASQDNVKA